MDPIAFGIVASVVTVVAFLYMLIFGQRGIIDWLERRKQRAKPAEGHAMGNTTSVQVYQAAPAREDAPALPPALTRPPAASSENILLLSLSVQETRAIAVPPLPEPVDMDATTKELVRNIAQEIQARNCVFFLGAGVSIEAGLPTGAELAEMLAKKAGRPYNGESLQQVAENYSRVVGPVKPVIHDYVRKRLADPVVGPTRAHRALALMADRIDSILTTNWDNLLEEAFGAARTARGYQLIYRDGHIRARQQEKTGIVKLHGHIDDPDSYIVTKEDYATFRRRTPGLATHLRSCLTTSALVIVGYGQEDEDFQQIYEEVLEDLTPYEERRLVYVVNPREDIAWEQYWRDKAKQRFIRLSATDFIVQVYLQVKEIANRGQQLEIGRDLILCPRGRPVVEFSGLPGIGKTTLLAAIRREYERRDIHTASISFDENPDMCEDNGAAQRLILNEVLHQLSIQGVSVNSAEWKTQLKRRRQVALFFDALDRVPRDTVCWLGETFVPLMDEVPMLRAVFACRSSRLPTEWPIALKPKVDAQRLSPFKRFADTQRQMELEFFCDEGLTQRVFDLTLGYPGLVQRAIEWLNARKCWDLASLNDVAQGELSLYMDGLLDTYILGDVPDHLKPLVRQLAYYRGFSLEHVARILGKTVFQAHTWIVTELRPTGLTEQGPKSHPYAIDQTARELLQSVTLARDTTVFQETHGAIAEHLVAQLASPTGNWPREVAEYLYHLANELRAMRRMGRPVDTGVLSARLGDQLVQVTDESSVLRLIDLLDTDVELGTLVEDLQPGLLATLQQAVQQRAGELERGSA